MKKFITILWIGCFFITGCFSEKKSHDEAPKAISVTTAKVEKKDMIEAFDAIGHVDPFSIVKVRSRVEGQLLKVFVEEGKKIKVGDLLFQIDPRPYEAQLKKNQAELKENEASLLLAKERMRRNEQLVEKQYISEMQWDDLVTNVEQLEAMVLKNRASIEESTLYLSYCKIFAPIDGIAGFLNIHEGNMIQPTSNETDIPIITLYQVDPIYITFTLPEKYFTPIFKESKKQKLIVRVFEDEEKKHFVDGTLNLIDNHIDTFTATIKLRGIFDNKNDFLWPGKFYPTRLILKILKNSLVIPKEALMITTQGFQVYVLQPNHHVELRSVELGQKSDEEVAILSGIFEGEEVITKGQLNLFPNALVSIANPTENP